MLHCNVDVISHLLKEFKRKKKKPFGRCGLLMFCTLNMPQSAYTCNHFNMFSAFMSG